MPCAAWLEACTPSQLFALTADFDYKASLFRMFKQYLVSGEASLNHLHEWLQHPVASSVHGSEVDSQQPVDEVWIAGMIRSDAHSPLEHPRCTQTWVVGIDGCQSLLVQSFCLYSTKYVSTQTSREIRQGQIS